MYASPRIFFLLVCIFKFLYAFCVLNAGWLTIALCSGLRNTVNDEGVWRIRRQPGQPSIEVFRAEQTGHGDILTDEFINWRIKLSLGLNTQE
jgi:uncharacterized membrane protein